MWREGQRELSQQKRSLAKVSMYKPNEHILATQGKEGVQRPKGRMTEGEPGW